MGMGWKRYTGRLAYLGGALFFILVGVFIRMRNAPLLQGRYPLGLDPYLFLRYAREIVNEGSIAPTDTLRYAPIGFDVAQENLLVSYVIAWMHTVMGLFTDTATVESAALIYPLVFFFLGMIFFFLLIQDLFSSAVALISTGFLAVAPPYLFRTMMGFADKESLGMFFMFGALFFFYRAIISKGYAAYLFSLLSGIMTGLMAATWGGFKFLLLIIPGFVALYALLGKARQATVLTYAIWLAAFTVLASSLTTKYGGVIGLLTTPDTGVSYVVFLFLAAAVSSGRLKHITRKHIIVSGIIVIFAASVGVLSGTMRALIGEVQGLLVSGMQADRLMMTVAEARLPFFSDWISNFGLLFFMFYPAVIYMAYRMLGPGLDKDKRILVSGMIFFVVTGIIFSRFREGGALNGTSTASLVLLFFPLLAAGSILGYGYLRMLMKDPRQYQRLRKIPDQFIFILVWLLVMMVAARGGMRLFMVLAPVAIAVVSYMIVDLFMRAWRMEDAVYKYAIMTLILLISAPTAIAFAAASHTQAGQYGPSFNLQWQEAMEWVDRNTPENAVFAHWWDYGYWVQSEGNRPTITDGGNFIPYWNHLMGRHVLAAKTEEEALQFLAVHEASYLLIISDEIGKYTAYSSIGSDANFDIFSWIGTFLMDDKSTSFDESQDIYNYFFTGGVALDEDIIYDGKVFPARESFIYRFKVPVREVDDEFDIQQPIAFVYHQGMTKEIPVACLFDGEEKIFDEPGLGGCLRVFPRYLDSRHLQENGAVLYVSGKGRDTLWTTLFLFGKSSEHFILAYDDSRRFPLAHYGSSIIGPLMIWKIQYPEGFAVPEEMRERYLSLTTPGWMNLSRVSALAE